MEGSSFSLQQIKTYKDILFNKQKLNRKPDGKPWEFFLKGKVKALPGFFIKNLCSHDPPHITLLVDEI